MQIDLTHEIAGVPLRQVRDLFRRLEPDCGVSIAGVAHYVKCSEAQAADLVNALVSEGLMAPSNGPGQYFTQTETGVRLSAANAWKRFPRAPKRNL